MMETMPTGPKKGNFFIFLGATVKKIVLGGWGGFGDWGVGFGGGIWGFGGGFGGGFGDLGGGDLGMGTMPTGPKKGNFFIFFLGNS